MKQALKAYKLSTNDILKYIEVFDDIFIKVVIAKIFDLKVFIKDENQEIKFFYYSHAIYSIWLLFFRMEDSV